MWIWVVFIPKLEQRWSIAVQGAAQVVNSVVKRHILQLLKKAKESKLWWCVWKHSGPFALGIKRRYLRHHAEHALDTLRRPKSGGVPRHSRQHLLDKPQVVDGLGPDGSPQLEEGYKKHSSKESTIEHIVCVCVLHLQGGVLVRHLMSVSAVLTLGAHRRPCGSGILHTEMEKTLKEEPLSYCCPAALMRDPHNKLRSTFPKFKSQQEQCLTSFRWLFSGPFSANGKTRSQCSCTAEPVYWNTKYKVNIQAQAAGSRPSSPERAESEVVSEKKDKNSWAAQDFMPQNKPPLRQCFC